MPNPYRIAKNQNYTGEHFQAVYCEDYSEYGTEWTIYQLEPRMWVAQTGCFDVAVELVNRLDATGDVRFGE